jgi:hypothetical protein
MLSRFMRMVYLLGGCFNDGTGASGSHHGKTNHLIRGRHHLWGGQDTAGVDIFLFDADRKVVEDRDVMQPLPAFPNNVNTRF